MRPLHEEVHDPRFVFEWNESNFFSFSKETGAGALPGSQKGTIFQRRN